MTTKQTDLEPLLTLLEWEGRLTNSRVRELFGIKTARASEWIKSFRYQHPTWTELDTTSKSFVATWQFRSRKPEPGAPSRSASLASYLALVGLPSANTAVSGAGVATTLPQMGTPDPIVFSAVGQAIRTGKQLNLQYRSMQQPKPHERTLSPHSLVRADGGWLVRAWCSDKEQFRDYRLNRMSDVKVLSEAAVKTAADDAEWNKIVEVRFIAHPALSLDQQEAVRFEFFGGYGAMAYNCRAALIPYLVQEAHVATNLERDLPPQFLLALENGKELKKWLLP